MKMTNNEKIFRLLGWRYTQQGRCRPPYGRFNGFWMDEPDVSNDYELCRKYIIPEMRERGFSLGFFNTHYGLFLYWSYKGIPHYEEIIGNNIAAALVEAAIKVLESENHAMIAEGRKGE